MRFFFKYLIFIGIVSLCAFGGLSCKNSQTVQYDVVASARKAYAAGHFFEAEGLYENYLQTNPKGKHRWEAWNRVLDISLNVRENPDKAAGILEAMILEFGDRPERAWTILSNLADTYSSMRRWDKAIETWKQSLNIPDLEQSLLPKVYYKMAKIYQIRREYDMARTSLSACLDFSQESETKAECLYELAQTMNYMELRKNAVQYLNQLLSLNNVGTERRALAVFMLADIAEQEERYDDAKQYLESIADTYPNPKVIETRLNHLASLKSKE